MVKDLVTKNVGDEHIIFCEDASNIVSHPSRPRKASVPVISVRIDDHCYYGLCDIGASSSAIPYKLYREIMHEIVPCELDTTRKKATHSAPKKVTRSTWTVRCGYHATGIQLPVAHSLVRYE
jgi:hypothetical protein